jgi:hypothetical protein
MEMNIAGTPLQLLFAGRRSNSPQANLVSANTDARQSNRGETACLIKKFFSPGFIGDCHLIRSFFQRLPFDDVPKLNGHPRANKDCPRISMRWLAHDFLLSPPGNRNELPLRGCCCGHVFAISAVAGSGIYSPVNELKVLAVFFSCDYLAEWLPACFTTAVFNGGKKLVCW